MSFRLEGSDVSCRMQGIESGEAAVKRRWYDIVSRWQIYRRRTLTNSSGEGRWQICRQRELTNRSSRWSDKFVGRRSVTDVNEANQCPKRSKCLRLGTRNTRSVSGLRTRAMLVAHNALASFRLICALIRPFSCRWIWNLKLRRIGAVLI